MSRNRIILVTAGIMLSLFLASMESTVVATAMPTIVGQLGGLEHYSWVFSAFMLASTTVVPLYGKTVRSIWSPQTVCLCDGALPDRLSPVRMGKQHDPTDLCPRPAGRRRRRHPAPGIHPDRGNVHARTARQDAGFFLRRLGSSRRLWDRCWAVSSSISFRGVGSFTSTWCPGCSPQGWSRLPGGISLVVM